MILIFYCQVIYRSKIISLSTKNRFSFDIIIYAYILSFRSSDLPELISQTYRSLRAQLVSFHLPFLLTSTHPVPLMPYDGSCQPQLV